MAAFHAPSRERPAPQGKRQRIISPATRRETAEVKRRTRVLHRAVCILGMQERRAAQMRQPPNLCDLKSKRQLLRAPDEQQTTRQRSQQLGVAVLVQMQPDIQSRQQLRPRGYLIDGTRMRSSRQPRSRGHRITNEEGNS